MESGTQNTKLEVIKKYRLHDKDAGSTEVQIALLTNRIEGLSKHFGAHVKDNHSRMGMMKLINRRKKLLQYLRNTNVDRYKNTIGSLGLRK